MSYGNQRRGWWLAWGLVVLGCSDAEAPRDASVQTQDMESEAPSDAEAVDCREVWGSRWDRERNCVHEPAVFACIPPHAEEPFYPEGGCRISVAEPEVVYVTVQLAEGIAIEGFTACSSELAQSVHSDGGPLSRECSALSE